MTLFLQLLTYSRHTSRLANAVDYNKLNVLKNNIFISTMLPTALNWLLHLNGFVQLVKTRPINQILCDVSCKSCSAELASVQN